MQAFQKHLWSSDVIVVRLPLRSPDLNAYAERFVHSIKLEYLERMNFFGEQHLRTAIDEYMDHYHPERNHHVLENRLVAPVHAVGEQSCSIERQERIGGMLYYYHRRAT